MILRNDLVRWLRMQLVSAAALTVVTLWPHARQTRVVVGMVGVDLGEVEQGCARVGARSCASHVQIGIPVFDPASELHQQLAGLAGGAEQLAEKVDVPAGIRFTDARKLIVAHLTGQGLQAKIKEAVTALLP